MPPTGHCRHCWGDCQDTCLLPGGQGLCIHKSVPSRSLREWLRLMRTRRFWKRLIIR
jgi:hypothetical protein